ncbi:BRO-F [Alphabaculovirus altermyunipunctae]|uniref:BRO-F n=1 Tax=Mythimna unipuncta nucleopolyhedrovirus TaxID=447897 RepID=A0A346TPP9_9ABAC|nr:BRO-F [Mythimna unipuncta nucleopolyhedrovirus]AXU41559.1 BRO-F [Mythimna unipuncta nucleopolyhedrovirus]
MNVPFMNLIEERVFLQTHPESLFTFYVVIVPDKNGKVMHYYFKAYEFGRLFNVSKPHTKIRNNLSSQFYIEWSNIKNYFKLDGNEIDTSKWTDRNLFLTETGLLMFMSNASLPLKSTLVTYINRYLKPKIYVTMSLMRYENIIFRRFMLLLFLCRPSI